MANTATRFTTPVGRLVRGNLYKPQDKDADGNPLVIKHGPDAGKPRVDYYIALAIAKGSEQHWAQTEWGKLIWAAGHGGFPQGQANAPTFAWKVTDGDSQVPNRRGKKPCEGEGYPGHWVLNFGGGFAPAIYDAKGTTRLLEVDMVKPGHYIQVAGSVDSNGSLQQPGVYLNYNMVAHAGFGKVIEFGPDPTTAGFGQSPLPAGASALPVGGLPGTGAATPAAPLPEVPVPAAAVAPAPVAAQVPAVPAVPVAPSPGILNVPAPGPRMTDLAISKGYTYQALKDAGWSDVQMVQNGFLHP